LKITHPVEHLTAQRSDNSLADRIRPWPLVRGFDGPANLLLLPCDIDHRSSMTHYNAAVQRDRGAAFVSKETLIRG
jgi:hypothetical protein